MKEKVVLTREWMEKNWGKRCKEFVWGCPVCHAWACYDYLTDYEDWEQHKEVVREGEERGEVLGLPKWLFGVI